jgi:hypothetical protein
MKQKDLLNLCLEEMIVHTTKDLKDQLGEAKDHKMIIEKLSETGGILYQMKYPTNVLEKIVSGSI